MAKASILTKKFRKDEQVIYIGDNIGLGITKDAVYIGGVPQTIIERAEKYPEIAALVVPLDDLIAAKKRLKEPGTKEYLANKAIKEVR